MPTRDIHAYNLSHLQGNRPGHSGLHRGSRTYGLGGQLGMLNLGRDLGSGSQRVSTSHKGVPLSLSSVGLTSIEIVPSCSS